MVLIILGFCVQYVSEVFATVENPLSDFSTCHWLANEENVGLAISESGIPREQLYITTKLWYVPALYFSYTSLCASAQNFAYLSFPRCVAGTHDIILPSKDHLFTPVPMFRNGDHHRVREAFEESLVNIGCEYIDLYLIHWPQAISETGLSLVFCQVFLYSQRTRPFPFRCHSSTRGSSDHHRHMEGDGEAS